MPKNRLVEKDFAVAGPLARSAEDLLLALDVLVGPDPQSPNFMGQHMRIELPPAACYSSSSGHELEHGLVGYRIAVCYGLPGFPVAASVVHAMRLTAERLSALGAKRAAARRRGSTAAAAWREVGAQLFRSIGHEAAGLVLGTPPSATRTVE